MKVHLVGRGGGEAGWIAGYRTRWTALPEYIIPTHLLKKFLVSRVPKEDYGAPPEYNPVPEGVI